MSPARAQLVRALARPRPSLAAGSGEQLFARLLQRQHQVLLSVEKVLGWEPMPPLAWAPPLSVEKVLGWEPMPPLAWAPPLSMEKVLGWEPMPPWPGRPL